MLQLCRHIILIINKNFTYYLLITSCTSNWNGVRFVIKYEFHIFILSVKKKEKITNFFQCLKFLHASAKWVKFSIKSTQKQVCMRIMNYLLARLMLFFIPPLLLSWPLSWQSGGELYIPPIKISFLYLFRLILKLILIHCTHQFFFFKNIIHILRLIRIKNVSLPAYFVQSTNAIIQINNSI